ncbi:MAG: ATP-binding protein, partial [Gemmatimonadaceae bacterium]
MTDYESWSRTNDEYLSLALAWLRARLIAITPAPAPAMMTGTPVPIVAPDPAASTRDEPSLWNRLTSRDRRTNASAAAPSGTSMPTPRVALPRLGAYDAVADATELQRQLTEKETLDPPPALVALAHRLGLSEFERNVLLLVCATELDTRTSALCANAQDDASRPHPTFALAMALFDSPSWDVLSPERPLRYWRLLEITQPSGAPLMSAVLRADERIVNYVKGLNYLD